MLCTQCGKQAGDAAARYCIHCGHPTHQPGEDNPAAESWAETLVSSHILIERMKWLTGEAYLNIPKISEQVEKAVEAAEQDELRETFEGWGFWLTLRTCVLDVVRESGYRVSVEGEEGAWTVEVRPKDNGKFDRARAAKVVNNLSRELERLGHVGEYPPEILDTLVRRLVTAASGSLEKHGDLRDAVKQMGDWELRDRCHPNASKRGDLSRILRRYVEARERYKDAVDRVALLWWPMGQDDAKQVQVDEAVCYNGEADFIIKWGKPFQAVAAEYVNTPNAHHQWLTGEIAAWVVQPWLDVLSRLLFRWAPKRTSFLASLGVGKERKRTIEKTVLKRDRIADLRAEVQSVGYNAGEVIRRFRDLEADDLRLPTIFVSVVSLAEQPATQAEPAWDTLFGPWKELPGGVWVREQRAGFACPHCGFVGKDKQYLAQHQHAVHSGEPGRPSPDPADATSG